MSRNSSGSAFVLEDVLVRFGTVIALDVARLEIPDGGLTVLAGPNGAGKTTLLRVMAGLLAPGRGRVHYRGAPVAYDGAGLAHRRRVTLLFQDPYLFRGGVLANVAYGPIARGADRLEAEAAAREALASTACAHLIGREANELSGGECKRVALARALATGAETLLLDEPTAQVDEENSIKIRELIASLATSGRTVVMSTHQPDWTGGIARGGIRVEFGKVVSAAWAEAPA